MVLIDEWYVWAEGPEHLSAAAAETIRDLVSIAIDDFCRRLEADLALLRGAPEIHIYAVR